VSTDLLGDLIWSTPAIRLVRRTCPEARISLLTTRYAGAVLRGNPHLDEILHLDRGGSRMLRDLRLRPWGRRLLGMGFDVAIQFNHWSGNASLLRAARIERVAGTRSGLLVGTCDEAAHFSTQRLRLVEELFGVRAEDTSQELFPSDADVAHAAALLEEGGIQGRFAAVHAGTSQILRKRSFAWLGRKRFPVFSWPIDRYAKVIEAIVPCGVSVVLTGTSTEAEGVQTLLSLLDETVRQKVLDLTGRTTPLQLAALLGKASLYVGADTGPTHVASAIGTPIVGLYGPVHPSKTGPLRSDSTVRVIYKDWMCSPCGGKTRNACRDNLCMKAIEVGEVIEASLELLGLRGHGDERSR
jgi:ADP-heptose:LPS heptosyltransferase